MSILSRFKGSKKASTRQPESKAGPRKPGPVPYRHVPTHAAADAMSGSSSGCKGEAKSAIKDAHKKRMSRPTSSVSLSMYATNNRLLRNYSQTTTTTQCSSTKPIQVHLGYMGYDGFEESVTTSKTRSLPAKSPLSSNGMFNRYRKCTHFFSQCYSKDSYEFSIHHIPTYRLI